MPLPAAPLAFPPGKGGDPTGVCHFPSPLQPFCVRLPNPWLRYDVLRRRLHVGCFCSQHCGGRGACTILVRWANGKQLGITHQKSNVTLLTSDTHQSQLHPHVQISDAVAQLNRTPKILGVTLDTHFTFGPHACDSGIIPQHPQSHASQRWRPPPPSNWPSRTTATMVIPQRPLPAPFRPLLVTQELPSLSRLGQWPHLSQLPLHRPHSCLPLQLSHPSHGSGPGGYVDSNPPGRQFLAGLPQSATCPHCRSISTPFLHNLHSRWWPPPPWPPAGPHHPHLTLHPTSSHPTC